MPILKFPKATGDAIDLLKKIRDERLEANRKVQEMQSDEDQLAAYIISKLKEQKLSTGRGKLGQFTIMPAVKIEVDDWDKYWDWIFKKKDRTLLQKRIAVTAVREQLDAGMKLPGVTQTRYDDYSLTTVKSDR